MPLVSLRQAFGAGDTPPGAKPHASRLVVVVRTATQHAREVGLIVDGLIGGVTLAVVMIVAGSLVIKRIVNIKV